MPIGGGPGQSRWLSALGDWLGNQSKNIQENYNLDKISDSLIEDEGFAAPMNKAAGYTIKGLSQVARPIAGIGGALGNVVSEAGSERLAGEDRQMPSVLDAAMTEQATGPKTLRETLTPLDVAGIAAGGVAGATAKALPMVSRIAGLADLGLSAADAALGVGDVKQGVEQGDYARAAMGVARVAGNAYGGTKAAQSLRELGIKVPDASETIKGPFNVDETFDYGPSALKKIDGRTTLDRTITDEGNDFTIRSGPEFASEARRLMQAPGFVKNLAEQVDFMHSVGRAFDEDGIAGNVQTSTGAKYIDDLTREKIEKGLLVKKVHVNLDGEEFGSTFTAKTESPEFGQPRRDIVPDRPVFFNPIAQAKQIKSNLKFLLESAVEPRMLEEALADVPEDLAIYARGVRAGEARIPELEAKYTAIEYGYKMMTNMGHEKVGHWVGASKHRKEILTNGAEPQGPLLGEAPEYKKMLQSYEGTQFELRPRQVSMDEPLSRGTTLFEPANNTVVTAIKDPTRLKALKAYMASDEFLKKASEWYRAASEAPEPKIAHRAGRVVNRAESAAISKEETFEESPTPPDSVPPGSSGGTPQGPQLPSLAKRIRTVLTDNQKVASANKLKRREIGKLRADALRANEEEFASQRISVEDFHATRTKIMSDDYGLIQTAQKLVTEGSEPAQLIEMVTRQAQDDAFKRNRANIAFEKMKKGERLQDNEIRLVREVINDRFEILAEDGAIIKIGKAIANATGSTRALMTAYDLSAAGRQALYASVMNPTAMARSFKAQLQALRMTPNEFKSFMNRLKDQQYNPFAEVAESAGLHFSEAQTAKGANAVNTEEAFYNGKWAEKIPGVRQSEQAYIAYLNKIRVELFNKHAKVIMDSGEELLDPMTGKASQKMQDLAYMINTLTGRGELSVVHMSPNSYLGKKGRLTQTYAPGKKLLAPASEVMSTVFFAPRFAASRAALMRDTVQALVGGGLDPQISKIYMKNVWGTIGAVTSTMAALAATGVGTFNADPRKKDFGVLRVGNTRYEAYGGLKPWAKIASLWGTDSYFSGEYQMKKQYGDGFNARTKTDEVFKFGQGKLSPVAGFLLEAYTGEDFMGRRVNLGRSALEHSMPMIMQTMYESWEANELDQLPLAVPLSIVGVGVNSYSDKRFKR